MTNHKISICLLTLFLFFTGVLGSVAAAENELYTLSLHYDKGKLSLNKEISLSTGYAPDKKTQPKEGYRSEVLSFNDDVLYSLLFEVPNKECYDSIDIETGQWSGECVEVDKTDFILSLPYFENGKVIDIYDMDNEKVLSVSIEHLAKTCGDAVCQKHENYNNCPQDCPSGMKDNYCDKIKDNKCDPDCSEKEDADCERAKNSFIYIVIAVGVIFIGAIAIFILKKRKSNPTELK